MLPDSDVNLNVQSVHRSQVMDSNMLPAPLKGWLTGLDQIDLIDSGSLTLWPLQLNETATEANG